MTLSEVVSWARENGRSLRKTSKWSVEVEIGKTRLIGYSTREIPGEIMFFLRFCQRENKIVSPSGVRLSDMCLIDAVTWSRVVRYEFKNSEPKTREDLDALAEEASVFMEEFSKRRIEDFKQSKRRKIIEECDI